MKILIALAAVVATAGLMATAAFAAVTITGSERSPNADVPGEVDNDAPLTNDDEPREPADDPSDDHPGGNDQGNDDDRNVVDAPIDEVRIDIRESYPVQYSLHIVSGLPSGCAAFDDLVVERDGNTITVTVTNTMPASDDVACTMIYGMKDHNVDLGSDFTPGETYTVTVNDKTEVFVAQ